MDKSRWLGVETSAGWRLPPVRGLFVGLVLILVAASVIAQPVAPDTGADPLGTRPSAAPATGPVADLPSGISTSAPTGQPTAAETAALATIRPLIANGQYTEVRAILEPLAQSPDACFDVLVKLGGAYDQLAKQARAAPATSDAAREEGLRAFRELGTKAVEYYQRAGRLALLKLDPLAESIYRQVLSFEPNNPEALQVLGTLAHAAGSVNTAVSYFRDYCATEKGRGDHVAQVRYGGLLVDVGSWHLAVDVLERVREVGGSKAKRELARAYLVGRQPEKAFRVINETIERDPNDPEAYMIRAGLVLANDGLGRPFEAIRDAFTSLRLIREAVTAKPSDDGLWTTLGETHSNCAKIVQVLTTLAADGRLESLSAVRLAELIAEQGVVAKLKSDYDAAFLLGVVARSENPDLDVLVALATRLKGLNRMDDARRTAERILQRDPSNPTARAILQAGETGNPPATQ